MWHVDGGPAPVDDLIVAGYQHVLESGGWDGAWLCELTGAPPDRVGEARRTLVDLRLIEPDPTCGDGWRAVSPRVAMAEVVTPIDLEVRRRAAYAENLRGVLDALLPVHAAGQRSAGTVEVVRDPTALDSLLEDEAAKCTGDLLTMRDRAEGTAGYRSALARGVRVRTVFQHGSRYDLPTEEFVSELGPAGARFRTADEVPLRLMIFGRSACVLVASGGPDAVVVRQPLVVAVLAELFEHAWSRSLPFEPADPRPAAVADALQQSILRLLATGAKDDAVARKLGISVRSCRRHVAGLMQDLGATSRFQTGVEAERRHLV